MTDENLGAASVFGAERTYNRSGPGGATNAVRDLTRSSELTRKQAPMNNTHGPRQLDELTPDFINGWACSYRYWTTYGISLAETEVGHPLPWARQVATALEPKPDPSPDP